MEDIGDYIYLIAIVIAGLSSLLKKRKPAGTQQESSMPDLEDVLTDTDEEYYPRSEPQKKTEPDFWDEPSVYTYEPEVIPQPSVAVEKVPVSYETVSDYMKLRAKKTVQPTHSSFENTLLKEQVVEPAFEIELDSIEDVKRAFVYAEIFNRKY